MKWKLLDSALVQGLAGGFSQEIRIAVRNNEMSNITGKTIDVLEASSVIEELKAARDALSNYATFEKDGAAIDRLDKFIKEITHE